MRDRPTIYKADLTANWRKKPGIKLLTNTQIYLTMRILLICQVMPHLVIYKLTITNNK